MKIIKAMLLLVFCITLQCAPVFAEVVDKIAIVVNNEIVTQGEIDDLLAPIYAQYSRTYRGAELVKKLEEARQGIVEQLIEERLILSEAKRLNIVVEEQDVEDKIRDSIKRFGSRQAFEAALKEQGIPRRELRERYRDQIMSRRLIDQKVGSKIMVNPVEIEAYYRDHPEEFARPETIRLRNILVRPKSDSDAPRALRQAKEILRRLREGCDFAGLAKAYSEGPGAEEGGLTGYVKRGDLLPEIEKVVFNAKEGETTGIIQTRIGYHIFKVEERLEPQAAPLSEIRREAEDAVFGKKIRDKLKGWLEGLKKNAYIAFR